jgi:6-phosphogluconolactonase
LKLRDSQYNPSLPGGAISRRGLLAGAVGLTALSSSRAWADDVIPVPLSSLLYIGAYTPNGQGIYLFRLDPFGRLTQVKVAAPISNPSWIAIHPNKKYMYAVNEISNFNGGTSGSVTALSIDSAGNLTVLNVVSSQGGGPAHLSVDPIGEFVFVANYGGGSFAVLPINSDGSLANFSDVHLDTGSLGPMKATNAPPGSFAISGHDAPHAHMIQSDPAGKYVFGTDLGQDRIYSWLLNRSTGKLIPNTPAYFPVPPGDGPRHFAFHPNGLFFYSIQEEASTLEFFTYNAATGVLTEQQIISTLPPGFVGTNFTSEVRVSQNGRYVYAANRLHDTIAVFSVGPTGRLTRVGEASTLGDYPRSFTIDPTGNYLISCNQRSDALTTFRVLPGIFPLEPISTAGPEVLSFSGGLEFTGNYTPVGSPAVVAFLNLPSPIV